MPLNVRRIFASFFLVVFGFTFSYSQTTGAAPTAADVMRARISKAKTHIVLKNYTAAIYELENIRRETSDPHIHAMLNVLLMHSYLEQADYKRAQTFLDTVYNDLKANKPNAMTNYYAVAGQIIKGAKNQLERYRSIGLSISDRSLPTEAVADIEKMRETLETVVTQAKSLSADKQQIVNALPILEEATNARGALAKDDYDANRWKQEITDAREMMINSRGTIISAVDAPPEVVLQNTVASNTPTVNSTDSAANANLKTPETTTVFQPVPTTNTNQTAVPGANLKPNTTAEKPPVEKSEPPKEVKQTEEKPKPNETPANNNQPTRERIAENSPEVKNTNNAAKDEPKTVNTTETAQTEETKNASPVAIGSLIEYATKRVNPVYPVAARSVRMTGNVRVDVIVDENGKVVEIQNTNGPGMLQRSALDAIRKWEFKPFVRDGQPVKAVGFVNFNFSL